MELRSRCSDGVAADQATFCAGTAARRPLAMPDTAPCARCSHFSAWLSQFQLASGCSTACCRQIEHSSRYRLTSSCGVGITRVFMFHSLSGAICRDCRRIFAWARFRPHRAFLSTTLVKASAVSLLEPRQLAIKQGKPFCHFYLLKIRKIPVGIFRKSEVCMRHPCPRPGMTTEAHPATFPPCPASANRRS